jgi:hypothetical protein
MSIVFGSATVPASTTGTFLFQIPPGQCQATFYNPGPFNAIYIGQNTAPSLGGSPASGFLVPAPSTPATILSIPGFTGGKGCSIYGATGGTASTFATTLQYILSFNA